MLGCHLIHTQSSATVREANVASRNILRIKIKYMILEIKVREKHAEDNGNKASTSSDCFLPHSDEIQMEKSVVGETNTGRYVQLSCILFLG